MQNAEYILESDIPASKIKYDYQYFRVSASHSEALCHALLSFCESFCITLYKTEYRILLSLLNASSSEIANVLLPCVCKSGGSNYVDLERVRWSSNHRHRHCSVFTICNIHSVLPFAIHILVCIIKKPPSTRSAHLLVF